MAERTENFLLKWTRKLIRWILLIPLGIGGIIGILFFIGLPLLVLGALEPSFDYWTVDFSIKYIRIAEIILTGFVLIGWTVIAQRWLGVVLNFEFAFIKIPYLGIAVGLFLVLSYDTITREADRFLPSLESGISAYENENYGEAKPILELWAERGNRKAYRYLGHMYRDGKGYAQNPTKALEYFKSGGDLGDSSSAFYAAYMAESGEGTNVNFDLAHSYYEIAISKGSISAQNNLGLMYKNGHGVRQDILKAAEFFREASNAGSEYGTYNLARLHQVAAEFAESRPKAITLFRKAASQGHKQATAELAYIYSQGVETPEKFHRALVWAMVANKTVDSNSTDDLVKKLSARINDDEAKGYTEAANTCVKSEFVECP